MADDKGQTGAAGGGDAAPSSGSSSMKRILFILIGLVLVCGAGAGGFLASRMLTPQKEASATGDETVDRLIEDAEKGGSHAKPEDSAKPEGKEKEGRGEESKTEGSLSFALQPIGTNLNEDSVRRAVQVAFVLQASDEAALEEIKENEPRIRSAIIILLGSKTVAELRLVDGKELLAEEVKARANQIVGQGKIKEVLYEGFVLQ
ncbi:flagellar basal body-associated FliL family protein [Candidatus Sumerlaeota bacterium]|nr:flagellar basal body-associated FliL family protein [Candidatus Sumerlaeota bacterium]